MIVHYLYREFLSIAALTPDQAKSQRLRLAKIKAEGSPNTVQKWMNSRIQDRRPVVSLRRFDMENRPGTSVVEVDRLEGGVIVTFDDGKSAFYSAALLRDVLPQAKEVDGTVQEWGE